MSHSDIPHYNSSTDKVKSKVDEILSSLSNFEIIDAIKVARIASSYLHMVSQSKLKGQLVNP